MISLRDIYYKVGKRLQEQDFDILPIEIKKQLVEENLKSYLLEKVAEGTNKELTSIEKEVTTDDLVTILGDIIPKEKHFDELRHLTHFILNIAGEMQGWSITWWDSSEAEYIDNPLAEFNDFGKWESLTSNKETSYVQTFHFVNNIYKEKFMEKTPTSKKLRLKQPTKTTE